MQPAETETIWTEDEVLVTLFEHLIGEKRPAGVPTGLVLPFFTAMYNEKDRAGFRSAAHWIYTELLREKREKLHWMSLAAKCLEKQE